MPTWGNTDNHNQKPKWNVERETREVIQLTVTTGNTSGNNVIVVGYNDGGQNNVANIGVQAGQYVYFWANGFGASNGGQAGNGIPGMFASNTTVSSTSGNTITLTNNLFNTVSAGFGVEFDKAVDYSQANNQVTYNKDTVLVTPTRMANTVGFANNSISHAGWVNIKTGTGGRAGRVQSEVLVALANPVAANTLSGNTSNSGVYLTGV